jgi:hypothetical protein
MPRLLTLSIPPPHPPSVSSRSLPYFPTVFCLWDFEQKILHQQVAGPTSAVQSPRAAMSPTDRISRYFFKYWVVIQSFGTPCRIWRPPHSTCQLCTHWPAENVHAYRWMWICCTDGVILQRYEFRSLVQRQDMNRLTDTHGSSQCQHRQGLLHCCHEVPI